jgi:hypothetical protein
MDDRIKHLVEEIIKRVAGRLGADGTQGELVVAFSGTTVGRDDAVNQVRGLIYDGYRILIAFSENAKNLFGAWIEDQLLGLPFVSPVDPSDWYSVFAAARAVVVPLLSLNTAARVAGMITETLPANLMLQALASGKPLFVGLNGVRPEDHHWAQRQAATPAFRRAALKRVQTLEDFGGHLIPIRNLRREINRELGMPGVRTESQAQGDSQKSGLGNTIPLNRQVVTAACIREAHIREVGLRLSPGTIVTPLAKDLASRTGVRLIYSPKK